VQAFVFTRYGSPDDLELREVEKPIPGDDEVLIKVCAVSLNDWDWALRGDIINRFMFGLRKPKKNRQILGSDIAGTVEAVGRNAGRFKPGDEVFGDLSGRWGGLAEYVCAPEKSVELKSRGMTFEQAASIPQAGLLALQGLRALGGIQPGQRLLINGAGGGAGTFAVQIAKLSGAEITAVDSAGKLSMLSQLGADHVIDYEKEDFTRNGQRYDFILDAQARRSVMDSARSLNRDGVYVVLGGSMARLAPALITGPWLSFVRKKHVRVLMLKQNKGLLYLRELFDDGKLVPVIDRPFAFKDVVDAFRYFATARHLGKVVITVHDHAST
jgi:NADPH:quinone reductase-like Zn-dependent oxidoreductase